ncbi:hypothetical protein [Nocardia sp. NPDC005998]|uniref:hypothetical protein n=1 Tax=Nocardia sp. NPDC005998 TaxID=3156894 RepID=UPI00339EB84C
MRTAAARILARTARSRWFLLAAIDADFRIEDGDELAAHLRRIMVRCRSVLD